MNCFCIDDLWTGVTELANDDAPGRGFPVGSCGRGSEWAFNLSRLLRDFALNVAEVASLQTVKFTATVDIER